MLEINVLSIMFTGLVALGLISAQAALSKKNFVLTVSTSEALTKEGYTRDVIEALFFNEIEWVARTKSMIAVPRIESSKEKGLVTAIADMLHMGELSLAMQEAFGKPPYRVWTNLVNESGQVHALVFGSTIHGDFQRVVANKGDIRLLVRESAHVAIRAIDPYLIALHQFELGQNLAGVETLIDQELARQRTIILTPVQQAAFHNLKGLLRLEKNDKQGAMTEFDAAYSADPEFDIARVNRAFTLTALDRYTEATAVAQQVLASPSAAKIEQVILAARMIVAVAKWARGDQAGAEAELVAAIKGAPNNGAPLVYWLRMLNETGRRDPAVEKLAAQFARTNTSPNNALYGEVAMLYFWVGKDKDQRVMRREIPRPTRSDPDSKDLQTEPSAGTKPAAIPN